MPKILIIDSDAAAAAALTKALTARGVKSLIVEDGAEGLKAAKDESPNAIVLCVELSRVSGYSICNKLKKSPDLARIPLILTSDKATEETFEQHKKLKTRAEQYLKKPYEMDQMLGLIAQYVEMENKDDDELEVSMDDMEVDVDSSTSGVPIGGDDAEVEVGIDGGDDDEGFGAGTQVTSLPSRAPSSPRAGRTAADEPAAGGASSAQAERMRDEIKQLRQKVAGLETTLQEKESEFTERLLQESSRGREGIEIKKKLGQLEREITKQKSSAEKAELKANEGETQIRNIKNDLAAAFKEKDALTEKIAQLVDKVKTLASERDQLRAQLNELEEAKGRVEQTAAQAEQVRAKAKKAVDIAMQLLDETGLLN